MVRQPGLAGALHAACALVVHQPPGGRGLLGLADTAGIGVALGGHRGRPARAPARALRYLRQGDGLVCAVPAAPVRRARSEAPPAARLRVLSQLLVRLQAGVLGPALGADRRGRPVPRPVLFAGQRLHCHRQHLHHRADRTRPRGPATGCARAALRPDLPLVLRQHAGALHRPVRPVRRPRGAARKGDLGLRLLLGRVVATVLPGPAGRPRRLGAFAH